jgi:sugar phosphate isomerase/epimerase
MAASVDAPAAAKKFPIGFSTLGCPAWSWDKILNFAQTHGFTGVEPRGLRGNMDLPTCPEFSPGRIEQSKKDVAADGLHISSVDSSAYMNEPDPGKHEGQLADARRFIDLAFELGAPYVRVFGNQIDGTPDEAMARVAKSLRQLGDYSGPKNVTVLMESHGDFTHSPMLLEIFERQLATRRAALGRAQHLCEWR